jgi:flagellar biosynthetic protein FlhB
MQKLGMGTIAAIALPFGVLMLAAVAGNIVQHRLVWSGESLKPKLSKISLGAGFKRLFFKIALMNFIKGLIKLGLVGAIMSVILWPKRNQLDGLVTMDPAVVLLFTRALSLDVRRQGGWRCSRSSRQPTTCSSTASGTIGPGDVAARLKEEFKQTDGDPHIKAKIRQLRVERSKKHMMAAVPCPS